MSVISILGLGYVGATTAACLASRGHKIIGVDPNPLKVEADPAGMSPIVEKGVPELMADASKRGLLSATVDSAAAIAESEISFISVGTPSQRNGKLNFSPHPPRLRRHRPGAPQQEEVPLGRRAQHRPAGDDRRGRGADDRGGERQEGRPRLPRLLQPRVPARRTRPSPTSTSRRSRSSATATGAGRARPPALRLPRRAASRDPVRRRRDGEIRVQRIPRRQGGVRQRDRHALPRGRRRPADVPRSSSRTRSLNVRRPT